ncbi:MAG: RsmE family RNA methyltransferase [Limisphaerales bacterium]
MDDEGAESKRDKWQQVAIEAIKQCGATWLPKVEAPVTIEQFLARKEKFDLSLVGSLQKERRHPRDIFREFKSNQNHLPQSVAVWIGPEGDFTWRNCRPFKTPAHCQLRLQPHVARRDGGHLLPFNFEL